MEITTVLLTEQIVYKQQLREINSPISEQ